MIQSIKINTKDNYRKINDKISEYHEQKRLEKEEIYEEIS